MSDDNLRSNINIQDSADSVVQTAQQGNVIEAHRLWSEFHATEPLAVREAYDRLIALQINEANIENYQQLDPNMRTQLSFSKDSPRIPSEDEMSALTNDQKFDVYNGITRLRGNASAVNALDDNDRVILGLRNENQTTANAGRGVYDDRIIVLWQDNDGAKHIEEFNRATTEPTAQYDAHYRNDTSIKSRAPSGVDINADGTLDMGRLRDDNTITMRATTHARPGGQGDNFSLRPTNEFIRDHGTGLVERDVNGDGWFDSQDIGGIVDLNNTFKIHAGSRNSTDSAGCQTIHRDDYDRFITAVNPEGSIQTEWQYVLSSTAEISHVDRVLDNTEREEVISPLSLNTGNETVDLLLANLENSKDNPFGFNLDVMMTVAETKEGKEFTDNLNQGVEEVKIVEASLKVEQNVQVKNKESGIEIG